MNTTIPTPLPKAYTGKKFTYASPEDSRLKRWVISTVEILTGRRQLIDMLKRRTMSLKNSPGHG